MSRTLVGAALAVTAVGPLLADFVVPRTARQHLRNPNWPPHAKFHDAQYIVMGMLTGGIGLRVLSRRGGDERARFQLAAALGSIPWLGMVGASLFPGTAATDPEFEATEPQVLGMHPQLVMALALLTGLSGAVTVESARSRR
ncbi:hypothetical protein FNH07_16810 [Amycolatopsis bartoniae]|nr:hypothetical protein FNH07_16810 [Amycolatopsis bartoniae]